MRRARRPVKTNTPKRKRVESAADPESWLKDLVRRKGEDVEKYEREVPFTVQQLVENYERVTKA